MLKHLIQAALARRSSHRRSPYHCRPCRRSPWQHVLQDIRQYSAAVILCALFLLLLELLLEGFDIEFNDRIPTQFYCNCSKERVERALISIGKKDIQEMIDEGKEIEMNCHFCNKNYTFTVEELKRILKECKR